MESDADCPSPQGPHSDTNDAQNVQAKSDAAGIVAKQVFETAELLEANLPESYMRTVLLAQRCTTFRDPIKGSIKLQRKLWFQPTPSGRDNDKPC